MGFGPVPTESGFALRSARYLASNGYAPSQITRVLVEELDIAPHEADDIASSLAA